MPELLAWAALLAAGYQPDCLQALSRFSTPPAGAACLSLDWTENGWVPTGKPPLRADGTLAAHDLVWSGSVSRHCELAFRVLEHEGVETFACLGTEGESL